MCQKALVLQTNQTDSAIDAFIEACSDIVFQCETSLAEAIQQLTSSRFDYVICCEHQPDVALQSLEQLKHAHQLPLNTRVLAFSFGLERRHKEQALELGIINFHDLNHLEHYDDLFHRVVNYTGNILVVDDNEENELESLIMLLEERGHIVSVFYDVNLAHDAIKQIQYDLLITDVFSLSNYLEKQQLVNMINTVVLSSYHKIEVMIYLLQLGAADVINNPIIPEALLLRIERILKINQRHRDELDDKTRHLLELSLKDALTGAYNRRYLDDVIEQRINFLKRHEEPFSVLILDIDNFKQINDTQGHQAGDKLLIQLVSLIQHHIRNVDCVCRYGGEEFVIVLAGCAIEAAMSKAEQIREEVVEIGMTISIGVAIFTDPKQNLLIDEHLNLADLALYQAKKTGKNKVVLYSNT